MTTQVVKGLNGSGTGRLPLIALLATTAAYALWELTSHHLMMGLPMATRHWLSGAVGTAITMFIAGVSVQTILRQQRELERLSRLKDDLTAMLVHDLRTPLTAVIGSLETVRTGVLGEVSADVAEMTDMALDGSQSLLGMVNDLLDISKLEAGAAVVERKRADIAVLVSEAVETVAPLASLRGLALEARVQPQLPPVLLDAEKVRRLLVNLLGNAVKFTPAGGRVEVRAEWRGWERHVVLAVSDTGEGIPKSHHQRIFDKFGQVETRKAGRKMSTGLGLTFCKLVAEAHGGSISVDSELGRGSTFTAVLPAPPAVITGEPGVSTNR